MKTYTQIEVEELLKEQRQLCADNATMIVSNNRYEGYTESDIGHNCNIDQFNADLNKAPYNARRESFTITDDYEDDMEHDESVEIDVDSIMNARLNLD